MDFNLKQWREQQHESEDHQQQRPPVKLPRLLTLEPQHHPLPSAASLALPLFVAEPTTIKTTGNMSACPSDPTATATAKFPRMGSYFSLAQWQELELQALIFRHMLAGAAIPPELLHHVKKSLLNTSYPYYFTHPLHHYPHLQPASVQSGYGGRGVMDPEPNRCRRTDGKKWRCSRDVVGGHKYCDRHIHRGRNRSRKPVEIPTPPTSASGLLLKSTSSSVAAQPVANAMANGGTNFHGPSASVDLLHLNNRSTMVEAQDGSSIDGKSGGQMLRHFFDDWPRSLPESDTAGSSASSLTSTTSLSVSDFSLKLSTGGDGNEPGRHAESAGGDRSQPNCDGATWASHQIAPSDRIAPVGGPLAEALRSSTSGSSPTSVLNH